MSTDVILEKIRGAMYLDDKTKRIWIERLQRDGLTPGTLRALMETVVEHAFHAVSLYVDRNDPAFKEAYNVLMQNIDAAQAEYRSAAPKGRAT